MENKKNAAKKKQEDIALSRALIWFGAAMVVEFLLLLVNKYYVNFTADRASIDLALALNVVLKWTAPICLVGAVVCGFFAVKKGVAEKAFPFSWVVLSVTLLVIACCAALLILFNAASAMELLYVLVPAGAVLALVYYLYQREFFFCVCGTGIALLGLWLVRQANGAHDLLITLYTVAAVVVLAALLALTLLLKKNQGILTIKGKQFAVLPKQSNYLPILLSCALGVLALVAGLILGVTVAFYLLFVLLAWLFVLLVYHTVKMM